jgi:hypothetical protein
MPVTFKSPPPPTAKQLSAAFQALGVPLPADYVTFLQKQNGGEPKPNRLANKKGNEIAIDYFYSIQSKRTPAATLRDLVFITNHFRSELDLPPTFLPIAAVDQINVMVLTVSGRGIGSVSIWSSIESGFKPSRVKPFAKNLGEVLSRLGQPSTVESASNWQKFEALETALFGRDHATIRKLVPGLNLRKIPEEFSHPIESTIVIADLTTLRLLHELGVKFDVQFFGQSPLQLAKERLKAEDENSKNEWATKREAEAARKKVVELKKIVDFLKKSTSK